MLDFIKDNKISSIIVVLAICAIAVKCGFDVNKAWSAATDKIPEISKKLEVVSGVVTDINYRAKRIQESIDGLDSKISDNGNDPTPEVEEVLNDASNGFKEYNDIITQENADRDKIVKVYVDNNDQIVKVQPNQGPKVVTTVTKETTVRSACSPGDACYSPQAQYRQPFRLFSRWRR